MKALPTYSERDRKSAKLEAAIGTPDSTCRKQDDKTTQQQTHAAFHEKGKVMTQKAEPRTLVDYSQTLESNQGTGISLLS